MGGELLLFVVLPLSTLLLICLLKRGNGGKRQRLPPGPRGLPLLGNLHEYDRVSPHVYLSKLAKEYGPLMWMRFGGRNTMVLSSARVAKLAFKNNDLAILGRPMFTSHKMISINNVDMTFSPYNEHWKELRKISRLHLFSVKQVKSFRPIRTEEVSCVIDGMKKKAQAGEVINLSEEAFFLMNNLICRMAFGKKYGEADRRTFDKLFKNAQELAVSFFVGDYFPLLGWIDRLTGMASKLKETCKALDGFYEELIASHLDPNRPDSMKGDILDLMINLNEEQGDVHMEWDTIKAVLLNIILGGSDTNSTLITWLMTGLMQTPHAMKKVQEEVRTVVGKKGRVDDDDIEHLPYLKAVIKETLRFFPPAPLAALRETIEKFTIDGYEIPLKTQVMTNVYAIGRDPEYWENPNEFLPDRFLNSTIDFKGQDFGLLPFGSGRRGCPGINIGMASSELALANLLYSFDWELPEGMKAEDINMETLPGLVMAKKTDLCLVAKVYAS